MADPKEYVKEQNYSLNAGRYIGIEIEDDNISKDEFRDRILTKKLELDRLDKIDLNNIKLVKESLMIIINE
jgi:type I restriction enzyme M protein